MESQFARIAINRTDAKLEIKQELPKVHMEQRPADVTIRTVPGKLTIDQTQAFADTNLMSIFEKNDRFSREGLQAVQEGTARRAREGKELMQIEHGGNVIAAQAKRNAHPPMKALGITFIPSNFSVKLDYQPAEVQIDVTTHRPKIQAETNSPQFTYHPGDVETSLVQKNDLKITVIEP